MSINHCPYDGNFCKKMDARFDAWQKVVLQSNSMVFPVNSDAFSDCPVPNPQDRQVNCERFRGCLTAINNAEKIRQELANVNCVIQK